MEHSFDIEIATKYDIHIAILLKNILFWIEKNRANNKHLHEGRYWTYNSKKAFAELFPYLTERQIKYTLDKMKKEGLILTGNFNKDPYDKTCWYTLTDMAMELLGAKTKAAETPENTHRTKLSNRADEIVQPSDEIVQPIPDNKHTDNKPNNIRDRKTCNRFSPPTVEEVKEYCSERGNNVDPEKFVAFYRSKGWKVGNSPMKDWKSAIITWERRYTAQEYPTDSNKPYKGTSYDLEEYEKSADDILNYFISSNN